jgi:uncharacterized protein YkwD
MMYPSRQQRRLRGARWGLPSDHSRRRIAALLLLVGWLSALGHSTWPPTSAHAQIVTATPIATPAVDGEETEFVRLLNAHRAANGVGPVALDPTLTAAADWMSRDMLAKDYAGHIDSLGRSPIDRTIAFGYAGWTGENLALGYTTAADVLAAWQDSPSHHSTMLGPEWIAIGVRRLCLYDADRATYCRWATDYGAAPSGAPIGRILRLLHGRATHPE